MNQSKKYVLINPQWQGGADKNTLYGAMEIRKLYLEGITCETVPVSESMDSLSIENGIIGYRAIKEQTGTALEMLRGNAPDRIFTVGGGCDADAASIIYANERYEGDLAVLWMDAHGDINSTRESSSKLFYGMPIRALLNGCGDIFYGLMNRHFTTGQFINFGGRDLDESERIYIEQNQIPHILPDGGEQAENAVIHAVARTGKKHLYIHLDLDVIDPEEFPAVPLPVKGGISMEQLMRILHMLEQQFDLVGFGIFEYSACGSGKKNELLEQLVKYGLGLT